MTHIIEARSLTRQFGAKTVVDDLSFSVQPGDVYGFLGQNGAGKSTTMRMLLGLIYPTGGEVLIKGEKFTNANRSLLSHIGAIIERPDMYGYLSGWDNLKIFARLSGGKIKDERLYELLDLVKLRGREKDKVKTYSQGMKQRLGIAIALVHSPDLLILDEPTNGLDPQGIAEMRQLITHLSKDHGKTIIISSHLLHEVEQIATRMLIIHKGKKIIEGSKEHLLRPTETLITVDHAPEPQLPWLIQSGEWQQYFKDATPTQFTLQMHPQHVPHLTQWLVANNIQVLQISTQHSLEALFLSLTNDAGTTAHRAV